MLRTAAERRQAEQQLQAAAIVLDNALRLKKARSPIPLLTRPLFVSLNKLKKQHYGAFPEDGESVVFDLTQAIVEAGEPMPGDTWDQDLEDAVVAFLHWINSLIQNSPVDLGGNEDVETGINGAGGSPPANENVRVVERVRSDCEADHLEGLAAGQDGDPAFADGDGSSSDAERASSNSD